MQTNRIILSNENGDDIDDLDEFLEEYEEYLNARFDADVSDTEKLVTTWESANGSRTVTTERDLAWDTATWTHRHVDVDLRNGLKGNYPV